MKQLIPLMSVNSICNHRLYKAARVRWGFCPSSGGACLGLQGGGGGGGGARLQERRRSTPVQGEGGRQAQWVLVGVIWWGEFLIWVSFPFLRCPSL